MSIRFIYHLLQLFISVDSCAALGTIQKYSSVAVSSGNTFQDLPRLRETADNTERYI
jgi:hypothetical protein